MQELSDQIENYFNENLSGSGFDSDWEISQPKTHAARYTLKSYYHLMNDVGYYVGYTPIYAYLELIQGKLYIRNVRYNTNPRGVYLGDYIFEMVDFTLANLNQTLEV